MATERASRSDFGSGGVEAALLEALPLLHRKIRQPAVERIAARISLVGGKRARLARPAALVSALRDVLVPIQVELAELDALTTRFARAWQDAPDEAARREVLRNHLQETV